MTNNHVLNKKDISVGKKIKFSLNGDKINFEIKINISRKTYINQN